MMRVTVFPFTYPQRPSTTYICDAAQAHGSFLVLFNAREFMENPNEPGATIYIPANGVTSIYVREGLEPS